MTVFFTILKVIGWILLALFLLLVLIVLSILFVPIRYKVRGRTGEENLIRAKASWLLGLLRIRFVYENGETNAKLWILFFPKTLVQEEDSYDASEKRSKAGRRKRKVSGAEEQETGGEHKPMMPEHPEEEGKEQKPEVLKESKEPQFGGTARRGIFQKIGDFFSDIRRRISVIIAKIKAFAELITDERNKNAVSLVKKELFCVLGKLSPRRLSLTMVFSAGKPDGTGILMGVIACFPAAYKNRWRVTPDFESDKAYAQTQFDVRGHIRTIHLLLSGIRLWRQEDVRRLIDKISAFTS